MEGLCFWRTKKYVRRLSYWGWGEESKNHDNSYGLLTQGSVSTSGVIMSSLCRQIQHGQLYQLSINCGLLGLNVWVFWIFYLETLTFLEKWNSRATKTVCDIAEIFFNKALKNMLQGAAEETNTW